MTAAMMVYAWSTGRRALTMFYQSPRRGVVGSFLAVSPVVSLLFGIVMLSTVDRVMPFYVLQLGQYFLIVGVCTLFLFVRDRVAAEYSDAALERSMIRQPRADRHRLIADFLLPRGASAPGTGLIIVGAWFLIFASRIGLSAVGSGSGKAAAGQSASDTEAARTLTEWGRVPALGRGSVRHVEARVSKRSPPRVAWHSPQRALI